MTTLRAVSRQMRNKSQAKSVLHFQARRMKSAGLVLPGCKGGFVLSQAIVPGLEAASVRAEFAPKVRNYSAEHKLQPREV